MKRHFYFTLIIIICLSFVGCGKETKNSYVVELPLKLVNEVKDQYDNLLQQVFYNEDTDEYLLKEYTYKLVKNKFVCIDQQTIIIDKAQPEKESCDGQLYKLLTIFYHKFLTW